MKRYTAAEYVGVDGQGNRVVKRYLCVEEPEPVTALPATAWHEQDGEPSAITHAMISLAILGLFMTPFFI